MKKLDFTRDSVVSLLSKMAVPAIIAMVVNGLYYLADAAFVGIGVGSGALGGLAVVFPVQMFIIAWGAMIGLGVASIISRKLGEGDVRAACGAGMNGISLALISGAVFTAVTIATGQTLVSGLGATAENTAAAAGYLGALRWGFVFVFLSMVGFNITRARGDAKSAGFGMLLGTVVNLALDPLFIFVFDMGVAGAAWATVIARAVSTFYFFTLLRKKSKSPKKASHIISERSAARTIELGLRLDGAVTGEILFLGVGTFLSQLCPSVVAVIVNLYLRKLGTGADLALYGILSRVHVFIIMPLLGLAQGFQPVAGHNFGSRAMDRVRTAVLLSLSASVGIGIILFMAPEIVPAAVLGLFTRDIQVIEHGIIPLRMTLVAVPLVGLQIIGFSLFQAVGKPGRTLLLSLSRQLIFLVPLLIVLPSRFGINGLWAAFPVADIFSAILSSVFLAGFLSGARAAGERGGNGVMAAVKQPDRKAGVLYSGKTHRILNMDMIDSGAGLEVLGGRT